MLAVRQGSVRHRNAGWTPDPDARPGRHRQRGPMSILQSHRQRVSRLNEGMTRLQEMHEQAFAVWNHIVHVREGDAADRTGQLDALHDEAFALADRIARQREEAFGSISRESLLRLSATVESAHPSLVRPEPASVPGE
jgi:hypothetical protein